MASAFRTTGTRLLTGVEELDKALEKLKVGAANKIARPALTKAARHLLKQMKAAVPANMKDMKRALGMRVDAKGGASRKEQRAKVGAGVGKASKSEARGSGKNTGVGISGKNVHWYLLGTQERETKSGKRTGVMPSQAPGLVRQVTAANQSQMLDIMRTECTTRLAALAKKGG